VILTAADLDRIAEIIAAGGVVAIPTDTVYGLACHPDQLDAAERILTIKRRPPELELSLLAASAEDAARFGRLDGLATVLLAAAHWPGPLSLIVPAIEPRHAAIPRRGNTIMVRVPDHALLRALLHRTGPLASTSANRHGEPPCTTAEDVERIMGPELDGVLDGGPAAGRASTIIDCSVSPPRMLRSGPLGEAEILPLIQTPLTPLKPALRAMDPQVADLLEAELRRQEETLELIPSENLAPPAVLEALGSWLNNKYAEGLPGKRYYGGCQVVDEIEQLAIDRAKALFGAEHVNVQPHCGSSANMAVYMAALQPGDTVLGMGLDHGGHLTHGSPVNFSGKLYHFESYTVDEQTQRLDMDTVRARAREVQPKMIVAGYSAYARILDFEAFADIAREVGATLLVDMAHFAGLVAGGAHPSPVPHADFVTLTTHKTMRGPWGGMILCKEKHAEAVDKSVFPGTQGGPHNHAIAAKAVMLHHCMQPEFKEYAAQVVSNAKAMAHGLTERGITLVSGGTDNHLMLIDLRPLGLKGKAVQDAFDEVGITVNRNTFPYHGATPFNPNGIRLGSPSVTTRGMKEAEMDEIAALIATMLDGFDDPAVRATVRERSLALCRRFPLAYRA
jgi:glycine hydroxymethyltransferase